jgi:hypothetical protein
MEAQQRKLWRELQKENLRVKCMYADLSLGQKLLKGIIESA